MLRKGQRRTRELAGRPLVGRAAGGNAQGTQTVGFDLLFVNMSAAKVANLVRSASSETTADGLCWSKQNKGEWWKPLTQL